MRLVGNDDLGDRPTRDWRRQKRLYPDPVAPFDEPGDIRTALPLEFPNCGGGAGEKHGGEGILAQGCERRHERAAHRRYAKDRFDVGR